MKCEQRVKLLCSGVNKFLVRNCIFSPLELNLTESDQARETLNRWFTFSGVHATFVVNTTRSLPLIQIFVLKSWKIFWTAITLFFTLISETFWIYLVSYWTVFKISVITTNLKCHLNKIIHNLSKFN